MEEDPDLRFRFQEHDGLHVFYVAIATILILALVSAIGVVSAVMVCIGIGIVSALIFFVRK